MWYKTWHQWDLTSSQCPVCLYPQIYCRAGHQGSSINHESVQCTGWSDHTEEHFSFCSTSTLRREIRPILHAGSVRLVCGVWAQSLLRVMHSPASSAPSAASSQTRRVHAGEVPAVLWFAEHSCDCVPGEEDPAPFSKPCSIPIFPVCIIAQSNPCTTWGKCQHSPWSPSGVLRHLFIL